MSSIPSTAVEPSGIGNPKRIEDVHGKRQLPLNVLSSWGGQIVLIVSGFLLPRLIDRNLGQEALGIWDFAWSLISHFGLIQAGVTGSINRYVARFRSQGDIAGLNRAVSSVAGVLRIMGALVLILTMACVWAMPSLLRASLSGHLHEARWLVFLLGTSLAVQVSASVYGGVLTGCHRWDWHNGVYAVTYSLMLGGMVTVLFLGYGLIGLAAVNLGGETLGRLTRLVLSYRVCPGLEIRRRHMCWRTAREMMGFGGKMFVFDCAYLLLSQTVSLLILTHLGPAAVALFSRPMALVRTVKLFVIKYANVFVPTASSLHGADETDELRRLAVKAARYGILICLPPMLFLVILGGDLLDVWMGGRYANGRLVSLLACAHFFSIAYAPLFYVLCGLNRHGRAGVVIFSGAAVGVAGAWCWLNLFHGGLAGIALAFGLPWTLVNGLYLPVHACRRLGLPVREFLRGAWLQPVLCCLPYAVTLVAIRILQQGMPGKALAWGIALGGVVIGLTYWRVVVPESWKTRLFARFTPRRV